MPIDVCYELVGRLRMHWTGFDGGAEARQTSTDFFARVRAHSRPIRSTMGRRMPELVFDCIDVRADPYAAGPTLVFRLRIAETTGERVHAIALRVQLRIEPQKRRYTAREAAAAQRPVRRPLALGGDAQQPLQFAKVAVMVPSFTGSIEVDVPVPCTYDLEIAATSYFHALQRGRHPASCCCSAARSSPAGRPASASPGCHGTRRRRAGCPSPNGGR